MLSLLVRFISRFIRNRDDSSNMMDSCSGLAVKLKIYFIFAVIAHETYD